MTGIDQTIFTLVAILVFYTMDAFFMTRFEKFRKARGSSRSYSYTILVAAMVAVLAIQPVFLPFLGLHIPGPIGLAVQIAGMLVILLAMCLHIWARWHLRQFYAERVEIQRVHYLVDTGPYSSIRHPVITSFFMFATGLLLINPAIPTLFVLGFTLWDFTRAARMEEQLLGRKLPGYQEYRQRTAAFFPRLSRGHGTGAGSVEPRH